MEKADTRSKEDKEQEKRKLAELNKKYEETFPGLRYVVFVNGRSREVVMRDMERRIERGDREKEKREAVEVSPVATGDGRRNSDGYTGDGGDCEGSSEEVGSGRVSERLMMGISDGVERDIDDGVGLSQEVD